MSSVGDWSVPAAVRPKPGDYGFDLGRALAAVVGVRANIPPDGFTADVLGTERAGNGVLIRPGGVVLTIGYLIVEADSIWLSLSDGRTVPGHVLAYDQESGLGLVQALARVDLPPLRLGRSAAAPPGTSVVVGGAGGRAGSVAAHIVGKQEFAGYWEYLLDEAMFTAPAHPHWGGTALIGPDGDLLGIGSLQLQRAGKEGEEEDLNMVVPIDLLPPILDDLLALGRPNRPPRPWLGVYAGEVEGKIVVAGLAGHGPAKAAGVRSGDILLAVAGTAPQDLGDVWRRLWALGPAGVAVPLTLQRNARTLDVSVTSADRNQFLKRPSLH